MLVETRCLGAILLMLLGFDVSCVLLNVLLAPPIKHIHAFYLGGDPAAGSPTATLLRLFPPYET